MIDLKIMLVVLMLVTTVNSVAGEDGLQENFKLSVGSFKLLRYDSSLSLTGQGTGAGVSIVPEDTFGWKTKQTVARVDGLYRFTSSHALSFSWYSIDTNSSNILGRDIEWVDQNGDKITIPTGAKVSSGINYDVFKVGYLWSFYHNEKVELAAGGGLHVTRIGINITSNTTSSGFDASSVNTTVPLPVLSYDFKYIVSPRLSWNLKSEFFTLSFDNKSGLYTDNQLGVEYRAFNQFNVGIGVGGNSLKISDDTTKHKLTYANRRTGILFYVAAYF